MQISFTDRALPTIMCRDKTIRVQGEKVSPHHPKITAAYVFISLLSRFRPSLTGLVVRGREECRATAENTPKIVSCVAVWSLMAVRLQSVALVLSDVATTVSHNLFDRCLVILSIVTQQYGQNAHGTENCNIYTNFCNECDT